MSVKVQYMSDLHIEFGAMQVPEVLGDVLVLAGDIHQGVNAIPWIEECAKKFEHVIYLLGNHEYYGQKYWKLPGLIRNSLNGFSADDPAVPHAKSTKIFDALKNVYFLDNESVKIDDVYFHGTTLWSHADPMLQFRMNDFMKIIYKYAGGYGKFSPEEATILFYKNKIWLKENIVPGAKNVVITHHAPSFDMINMHRYGSDPIMNSGYATDILGEFGDHNIDLWISGHTHGAEDKVINGIHCVSNCRGYVGYEAQENFNPVAMVEV